MIVAALVVLAGAAAEPGVRPVPPTPAPAVAARAPLRRAAPLGVPRRPATDPWFGPDKVKHFFLSAFIQSVSYSALRGARLDHGAALAGASITTAGFAVGKELHDRRAGRGFSARDIAWDAAGATAAGALMTHTLR